MKPDTIIYGGLAGVVGTIIKEIFDFVSFGLGWSKHLYWHIAASIFVLPKDIYKPGALFLGLFADLVISAFFGVALIYLIKRTGEKYLYMKGLGFGWFIWLLLFGAIINLHIVRITPTDIGTSLSALLEHSIFGLTMAWFIGRYSNKVLL